MMKKDDKIYDKNGIKLEFGDKVFDGYSNSTIENYYNEIYIAGNKNIWRIEEFSLSCYQDGYKLNDFVKVSK